MHCRFYKFEFGWKFLLLFVNLKILEWELVWGPENLIGNRNFLLCLSFASEEGLREKI